MYLYWISGSTWQVAKIFKSLEYGWEKPVPILKKLTAIYLIDLDDSSGCYPSIPNKKVHPSIQALEKKSPQTKEKLMVETPPMQSLNARVNP